MSNNNIVKIGNQTLVYLKDKRLEQHIELMIKIMNVTRPQHSSR
jgi:hypothetical protein